MKDALARYRSHRMGLAAIAVALLTAGAGDALAKKMAAPTPTPTPEQVAALASLKGPFDFGMSPKAVIKVLGRQVAAKYAEQISATSDVYRQDQLRRECAKEIATIKKSYVRFDGKKTGWEGAIIQSEFAHGTGESMLMFWETDPDSGQNQRRFFFFHEGRLYKMFIALNSDNLKDEQRNFDFLKDVMERRFGPGKPIAYEGATGSPQTRALSWTTKDYAAWALDNMQVFGAFCLVIASQPVVAKVAAARAALPKPAQGSGLVRGVIERDSESGPTLDEGNSDVVDDLVK